MQALILKKNLFSEGNEIITLYTRESGKVRGIARSVKSAKSKLAFGLQQLFFSDIELVRAHKNYTITGVRVLNAFPRLRESLSAINAALYATELLLKSTADEQPNEELFDRYLSFLEHLDAHSTDLHACVPFFVFEALGMTGYEVQFERCVNCQKPLQTPTAQQPVHFSARKGGLLCAECSSKGFEAAAASASLSVGAFKALREGIHADDITRDSLGAPVAKELQSLADNFSAYVLERDLKAGRFLV